MTGKQEELLNYLNRVIVKISLEPNASREINYIAGKTHST
jgi:hypothetical protein